MPKQQAIYWAALVVDTDDKVAQTVSVESRANNEQHARQLSVLSVRDLVPDYKRIKILSVGEMDECGKLVDDTVCPPAFVPDMAIVLKDFEPKATKKEEDKTKTLVPLSQTVFDSKKTTEGPRPFSDELLAIAGDDLMSYNKDNRPEAGQ